MHLVTPISAAKTQSTVFFLQKLAKSLFIYFAILHIIQLLNKCCLNEMPFQLKKNRGVYRTVGLKL